jgi:hypothetical protein
LKMLEELETSLTILQFDRNYLMQDIISHKLDRGDLQVELCLNFKANSMSIPSQSKSIYVAQSICKPRVLCSFFHFLN